MNQTGHTQTELRQLNRRVRTVFINHSIPTTDHSKYHIIMIAIVVLKDMDAKRGGVALKCMTSLLLTPRYSFGGADSVDATSFFHFHT